MLTLVGAGVSLAIMLLVLGEPALRACVPDPRGQFACLREAVVERLKLPVGSLAETSEAVLPQVAAPANPAPALPTPVVEPAAPVVTAATEPETVREPYRPAPGKLERAPVAAPPDNVAAPAVADVPPTPLPAETGSIETPVAPAVEALVEPERIELPQLPPPPLAPEQPERPATIPEPATVPAAASTPAPEPAQLADQPLPGSALPAPVAAPVPSKHKPVDSAAAAATAIADPSLPAAPPAPVAPATPIAEASPIPAEPVPDVTATPPAAPTIDTIAFDVTGTLVSGEGPQGARIELYVDSELAGEGEVVDGRWEVFGAPLFAAPMQTLRAVAIDPRTGRVIGETEISIELELPESAAPLTDDELMTEGPGTDEVADAAAVPDAPAPKAPEPSPPGNLTADLTEETVGAAVEDVIAPAPAGPKVLPSLRPVTPRGETSSVTILPDSRARLVGHPGSDFAILGD